MLPRPHRLTTALFEEISTKGRAVHSVNFSLKTVSTGSSDPTRVAFVVSGKVGKTAVLRNKLKRRARHIVSKYKADLKTGLLAALYFKPSARTLPFSAMETEITLLLKQARVL